MADGDDKLKSTLADMDKFLEKLGLSKDKIEDVNKVLTNSLGKNKAFQDMKQAAESAANDISRFAASFGPLGVAFYNTTNAAMRAGEQFRAAFTTGLVREVVDDIDAATKMSKEFRGEAIKVGSEFGLGFDEARGTYQDYAGAILVAQDSTYASRQEIERQVAGLARLGITLGETSKMFDVAGSQQNLLSVGFRVAADLGLESSEVFDKMAIGMRKMGLSTEDSTKPLLAIQNIARATGLPVSELSGQIFRLVENNARFGMSVENISPIVRRFTSVLGEGFKGFAIQDTERLIQGLAGQVNTANAAFIAMQSGLSRPGAGVAGAMLDYEDAMARPVEAMKMLTSSLASVTGGKILTFQDAHASEAAATQFKIQRDMLSQLTGINDPQQTRTLLALLAEQQSGKALSEEGTKTLQDALKSGAAKQDEAASLADKIGKAQLVLMAQSAYSLSTIATEMLSPQTESSLVNQATAGASEISARIASGATALMSAAIAEGQEFFNQNASDGTKKAVSNVGDAVTSLVNRGKESNYQLAQQRIAGTGVEPARVLAPTQIFGNIPAPLRPTVELPAPSPAGPTTKGGETSKSTVAPGAKGGDQMTITLRGEGELMQALAKVATVVVNKTLHGGG